MGVEGGMPPQRLELVPVKLEQRIADNFLYLLEVFLDWHKRVSWDYRDEESFDPPIGKPVFPEDVPDRAEKAPF